MARQGHRSSRRAASLRAVRCNARLCTGGDVSGGLTGDRCRRPGSAGGRNRSGRALGDQSVTSRVTMGTQPLRPQQCRSGVGYKRQGHLRWSANHHHRALRKRFPQNPPAATASGVAGARPSVMNSERPGCGMFNPRSKAGTSNTHREKSYDRTHTGCAARNQAPCGRAIQMLARANGR